MNPDSRRARVAGWMALLCAALLAPALVAVAAGPQAGDKRICVPSADGKGWECGTPENPPPERGLVAPVETGPGAQPPLFLAAPPSDPGGGYAAPAPAPAPAPATPLPDEFPTVQRDDEATRAPDPSPEPEPATVAASPAPPAPEPEPEPEPAPAVVADGIAASPELPANDAPEEAAAPPQFLAAPRQRRPFPLAPVEAPADTAREQAITGAQDQATAAPQRPAPAPEPIVADAATVEPAGATGSGTPDEAPILPADAVEPVASSTAPEPAPEMELAPAVDAETAVAAEAEPEPVPEPDDVAISMPAPPPAPDVQEPLVPAVVATPAAPPAPDPIATPSDPAGVAALPVTDTAEVASPTPAEPSPAAESASFVPTAPASAEESPLVSLVIHQATAFLRLPASAWTVQLSRGGRAIVASAPLGDGRQVDGPLYAVAVGNPGARQWLLLWSSFPDADAARRTMRDLRVAGVPRRIGPLQAEVRSAGTQPFEGGSADLAAGAGAGAATGASIDVRDFAPIAPADRTGFATLPAARFEALPASAWTVQLARAGSSAGFDALLTRSGLSPAECHVVAIDSDGARTYLLLWSQFADADAARAAARSLRGAPGAFVRRVGPLQAEARRAH